MILFIMLLICFGIELVIRKLYRKIGVPQKYSKSDRDYLDIMGEYLPNVLSVLILDYIKDHPTGYKFIGKFQTQTDPINFAIYSECLYTIEMDLVVRKYELNSGKLIVSWPIYKLEFVPLYGITVNAIYVIVIDYIKNEIFIFSHDGKSILNFVFENKYRYLRKYVNDDDLYELSRIESILDEKMRYFKKCLGIREIIHGLKFYDIRSNNDFFIIRMGCLWIKFDISGNLVRYKVMEDQLLINNRDLIICSDKVNVPGADEYCDGKIFTCQYDSAEHIYVGKPAVKDNTVYVRTYDGYIMYDFNGKKLASLENINWKKNIWHDSCYIRGNNIYELVDDTNLKGKMAIYKSLIY